MFAKIRKDGKDDHEKPTPLGFSDPVYECLTNRKKWTFDWICIQRNVWQIDCKSVPYFHDCLLSGAVSSTVLPSGNPDGQPGAVGIQG